MSRRSTPWDQYQVTESGLYLSDNTIADVSTARHGLVPKLPNDATKYLDGTGAYTVPVGAGMGGAFLGCRVRRTTSQTITTSTLTALTFDAEDYDTNGMHSTVTNTDRLTIQAAGYYDFLGGGEWGTGSSTAFGALYVEKNGTTIIAKSGQSGLAALQVNADGLFIVGDYVRMLCFHDRGSNTDMNATAAYSPYFSAKLRGT